MSGMSAYDNVMDLVKEQIAAMAEYRELLARCQAENKRLLDVVQYYGKTDWRELSMTDRGEVARQTHMEVMGNGRSETV